MVSRHWEVGEARDSTVFAFIPFCTFPLTSCPWKMGALLLSQKAQEREHGDDREADFRNC